MDGAKYREILEGKLFQSSRDLRLGQRFTFLQDDDPSKATLGWFKVKHLNVLEWASQSPDVNPIENLWHDFKDCCTTVEPIQLEGAAAVLP